MDQGKCVLNLKWNPCIVQSVFSLLYFIVWLVLCVTYRLKCYLVFSEVWKVFLFVLQDNNADEVRLSTVISDDRFDNSVVQVNKFGFHPAKLYVQKVT